VEKPCSKPDSDSSSGIFSKREATAIFN